MFNDRENFLEFFKQFKIVYYNEETLVYRHYQPVI